MLITELTSVTSSIAKLMLDASMQAQKIYAHNLANSSNKNYVTKTVNFERLITSDIDAVVSVSENNQASTKKEIAKLADRVNRGDYIEHANTENVQLDQEMIAMTKNVLKYQALLLGMSKLSSINKMAISGEAK